MVRHTDATTTRRTRTDLEYLAAGDFDDAARNRRLVDHGWVGTNGRKTGDGEVLAATVDVLRRRGRFDQTVDAMGMADFVDAVTTAPEPLAYLAGVRTVAAIVDASVTIAETEGAYDDFVDEYDPTPSYTFHPRRGEVEVGFGDDATARVFETDAPDRWSVERKHDERFKSNRNPRRFVVDVTA